MVLEAIAMKMCCKLSGPPELNILQDQFLLEPAILVSSSDVTSQKELEMALEAAKKQLLMYAAGHARIAPALAGLHGSQQNFCLLMNWPAPVHNQECTFTAC